MRDQSRSETVQEKDGKGRGDQKTVGEKRARDGSHKPFTVGQQASNSVRRGIRGVLRKGAC